MTTNTAKPPLSPEMMAQLDQLKDIRLPQEISWWPLAPGWWALAIVIVLVLVGIVLYRMWRNASLKYAALKELKALDEQYEKLGASFNLGAEISILLKRICLQKNKAIAASNNVHLWQDFLSQDPNGMSKDIAHHIALAPYAPTLSTFTSYSNGMPARGDREIDGAKILAEAESWIRKNT